MRTPDETQPKRENRFLAWTQRFRPNHPGGTNGRLTREPGTAAADPVIEHFRARWALRLSGPDGDIDELRGSELRDGLRYDHGVAFTLQVDPRIGVADLLPRAPGIASALEVFPGRIVLDQAPGAKLNVIQLRIVIAPPAPAWQVSSIGGSLVLGRHIDGIDQALWQLYTDDQMWSGLIVGERGDDVLEAIGLAALLRGDTYVIHLDPHEGLSCPDLWAYAQERYATDDVPDLLDRLIATLRYRQVAWPTYRHWPCTSSYPGVLLAVSEPELALTDQDAEKLAAVLVRARFLGIGAVVADPVGRLESLKSPTLRRELSAGNHVVLSSPERVYAPDAPIAPDQLERGDGLVLGPDARRAPFRLPHRRTRLGRSRMQALPADVRAAHDRALIAAPAPTDEATARGFAPVAALDAGSAAAANRVHR